MSRIKQKKLGDNNKLVWTRQDNTQAELSYGTDGVFEFSKAIRLPDGTAAAPSLSFDGSNYVGIYESASNVLGFATAGSERVTIDAQGDLNVGTNISIGDGGTGAIVGDKKSVTEGTGAAVALTAAMSGKVFFINSDSGATTYTLPAPSAGLHYKWIWTSNNNDATIIQTADTTDTTGDMLRGCLFLHSTDNDVTVCEAASDVNTLTLDDNLANAACGYGSWVEIICTEDPVWFVTGMINGNTDTDGTGSAMFSDVD